MHASHSSAVLLVSGVIIGSLIWWILLSTVISVTFKNRLNYSVLQWINYLSAGALIIFGLIAILSLL